MAVTIAPKELGPVKTVMRDLQLAAARYHAETADGGELGSTVRAFITHCQTLNDWYANAIADTATYKQYLTSRRDAGADVIDAVKYVRNLSQHVLHVIKPSDTVTLVGGAFGYRTYAQWEAIPDGVHAKLRPGTQALRPAYQTTLEGKEVMSTMMDVLRFFADVAPGTIHRDHNGEWTGFPLMNQPGMPDPLHPEEPRGNIAQAREWMNNRRPNGDGRVICGQVSVAGAAYVYGYTFVGRLAFTPFYENYSTNPLRYRARLPLPPRCSNCSCLRRERGAPQCSSGTGTGKSRRSRNVDDADCSVQRRGRLVFTRPRPHELGEKVRA
ncbi:hypothetical protein [Clavibacter michiganensis]|uniref:hypothetical protein n=1 Tax=Clavibacter michiganensis TaxID=28447 RepID=UPI001366402C|nr:hypothetical protein [Clavibacter michiganensis]